MIQVQTAKDRLQTPSLTTAFTLADSSPADTETMKVSRILASVPSSDAASTATVPLGDSLVSVSTPTMAPFDAIPLGETRTKSPVSTSKNVAASSSGPTR